MVRLVAARLGPARSWPTEKIGRSELRNPARQNFGPVRALTEPTERTEECGEGMARAWPGHGESVAGAWWGVAGAWQVRGEVKVQLSLGGFGNS